jgi:hypothetical protein
VYEEGQLLPELASTVVGWASLLQPNAAIDIKPHALLETLQVAATVYSPPDQ